QRPQVKWQKSTGISTIKTHFRKYHVDIYNQIELELKKNKTVQPYRIDNEAKIKLVKDLSFVELIEELDEWYRLPSRQTISNQIEAIYQNQKLLLKNFLKTIRKLAIITDSWTACNNSNYMSITLYWINDNWNAPLLKMIIRD
ncbi:14208_t:CDS:2, partial [Dentiscutata erythropus]